MKLTLTVKETPKNDKKQKIEKENRLRQEVLNNSLVSDTIEIFNGKVLDVKIL
jgi:hypothetical protein